MMTRPRLLVAFAATLVALGIWLLLWRSETAPEPRQPSPAPTVAEPPAPASAEALEQAAPAEIAREPAPPSPGPAGPAKPAAKTKGLSGVVKEVNGDGLPDILVQLVDADDRALLSTTTDDKGRFAFEREEAEAKAAITRPAPAGLPRIRHALPRMPMTSGPGGPAEFTIHLWRPPTNTITGRVVDEAGTVVAGAVVSTDRPYVFMGRSSWKVLDGPEPRMSFEAKTDAEGHFELPFMMRGKHLLRAESGQRNGTVKVDANEAGVVIRLGTHLGGAVVLSGQLTDRFSGAPIAGARVWVQRVHETEGGGSRIGVGHASTDAQGRYEIAGLEAGSYLLGSTPDGYAPMTASCECEAGQHVVDMTLLPARSLRVLVRTPDGKPTKGVSIRIRDGAGAKVQIPGQHGTLSDEVRTDADGVAVLRRLPAAPLTVLAVRGDLAPAARLELDLRGNAPNEVTIELAKPAARLTRTHYFLLLGPDGKPAEVDGTVVASSFDGDQLLSRVEGQRRGDKFVFGNDEHDDFRDPTVAVGAIAAAVRVEIEVPGYQKVTLTLEPDAKSPTTVTLQR